MPPLAAKQFLPHHFLALLIIRRSSPWSLLPSLATATVVWLTVYATALSIVFLIFQKIVWLPRDAVAVLSGNYRQDLAYYRSDSLFLCDLVVTWSDDFKRQILSRFALYIHAPQVTPIKCICWYSLMNFRTHILDSGQVFYAFEVT